MEMRYYLAIFLTVFVLSSTEASKAAGKVKIKSKTPVYFPVLLISEFDEDFGSRVSESVSHSKRVPSTHLDSHPLVSVQKLTTTTEKLPLAQESHASNSITEAPGPAYLREEDEVDYDSGYLNVFDAEDSKEDREGEALGVYLQSISSFEPPLFSKNRSNFDILINPAKMHYIPPNSGEIEYNGYAEEINGSSLINGLSSENISPQTEPVEYKPPFQATTVYEIPKDTAAQTSATESTPPLSYNVPRKRVLPEKFKSPTHDSKPVRYETPVRASRVIMVKPVEMKIVGKFVGSSTDATSSISSQSLFVKSTDIFMPKHVAQNTSASLSSLRASSAGYLPKPAPNPFAARISQSVVKPVYRNGDKIEISNFPANRKPSSLSEPAIYDPMTGASLHSTSTSQRKDSVRSNESSRRNFGERKPKIIKTVEIYRPPTSSENHNILFESKKRDYGFDFNSASGSAPKRQYKPPSVTVTPIVEAPVYRTSTKSYRAPSSLFQIKETVGKPVTAPSQPEFKQTDDNIYVPQEYDENAIPGVGGVDYPNFGFIPETKFKCGTQEHPGLYADQDTNCQVFHICQEGGREDSFLCPNGTVFNQQYFVCDWWYNFSCESADRFYSLNALIYELPDSTKYYT